MQCLQPPNAGFGFNRYLKKYNTVANNLKNLVSKLPKYCMKHSIGDKISFFLRGGKQTLPEYFFT